jgi:hypothetical protein
VIIPLVSLLLAALSDNASEAAKNVMRIRPPTHPGVPLAMWADGARIERVLSWNITDELLDAFAYADATADNLKRYDHPLLVYRDPNGVLKWMILNQWAYHAVGVLPLEDTKPFERMAWYLTKMPIQRFDATANEHLTYMAPMEVVIDDDLLQAIDGWLELSALSESEPDSEALAAASRKFWDMVTDNKRISGTIGSIAEVSSMVEDMKNLDEWDFKILYDAKRGDPALEAFINAYDGTQAVEELAEALDAGKEVSVSEVIQGMINDYWEFWGLFDAMSKDIDLVENMAYNTHLDDVRSSRGSGYRKDVEIGENWEWLARIGISETDYDRVPTWTLGLGESRPSRTDATGTLGALPLLREHGLLTSIEEIASRTDKPVAVLPNPRWTPEQILRRKPYEGVATMPSGDLLRYAKRKALLHDMGIEEEEP